jgi:hypothetical protein
VFAFSRATGLEKIKQGRIWLVKSDKEKITREKILGKVAKDRKGHDREIQISRERSRHQAAPGRPNEAETR